MQGTAAYAERITGLPEILRHLRYEQGRREEAQKAAKTVERKQQAQRATPGKTQTRRATYFYGD